MIAHIDLSPSAVVYVMKDRLTGSIFEMLPHTFGSGYVGFASVNFSGTQTWFDVSIPLVRFDNPLNNGVLSNSKYEIKVK